MESSSVSPRDFFRLSWGLPRERSCLIKRGVDPLRMSYFLPGTVFFLFGKTALVFCGITISPLPLNDAINFPSLPTILENYRGKVTNTSWLLQFRLELDINLSTGSSGWSATHGT